MERPVFLGAAVAATLGSRPDCQAWRGRGATQRDLSGYRDMSRQEVGRSMLRQLQSQVIWMYFVHLGRYTCYILYIDR